MKNWLIGGLVVALAVSIGAGVLAQSQRTANVEVRVWEDVNDPERNYISARPEGGSWRTLGTIPLPLTDGVSSSGRFRYGDITLAVPLPDTPDAPTATPTPTPAPSQATTATASATGPAVARISLGEGAHVCEFSIRENLSRDGTRVSDGHVRSRIINSETGDGSTLAGDLSDNGVGKWSRFYNFVGGDYLVEVTQVEEIAGWIIRCIPEERWIPEWRENMGRIGHGIGPTVSLVEIEEAGVYICTTSVSSNTYSSGDDRYFDVKIPALGLTSLTPFDRGASGTWTRVATFPEAGFYYAHATEASQSAIWSIICEPQSN